MKNYEMSPRSIPDLYAGIGNEVTKAQKYAPITVANRS